MNDDFKPGHPYSPIVSIEDVKKRESTLWGKRSIPVLNEVKLNTEHQLRLTQEFSKYYPEIPFEKHKKDSLRYYFENEFYGYMDAIILYSFMRHFEPRRIIEVGSGFSSAVMLDVRQFFFHNPIELTFIDPNLETLYLLITETDKQKATIISDIVQNVDVKTFERLQANDILFIDSSHVLKMGSDVAHLLFEVFPRLRSGVLIHFHDIFFPFEYPIEWIEGGRHWNEAYALRAFLTNNNAYEIQFFSDYLYVHHKEIFSEMPMCCINSGGNFWIRKM